MRQPLLAGTSLFSHLLSFSPLLANADIHFHDKDKGLYSFVSRPEIKAPRWKVNITDEAAVSPGHWFVAPFETIDQKEPGNGWVGPHIYDGTGELVWSGVSLVGNWDAIDFRMSHVRGEDLMTFLVQRTGDGYILDNTFEVREKVDVGTLGVDFNSHEFHFIEDGTHAIVLNEGRRDATTAQALEVNFNKTCKGLFNGFKELDSETWETIFEWSSFDHVSLSESTFVDDGVERMCDDAWGWDFVHLNSVDKDQNGDYYVSGRHTDTIYKVSKQDGHVMWRLHGRQGPEGEWDMDDTSFSRQHNVRFRGFNGTHEIITILDNADGLDKQEPTHPQSRGLTIALRTDVEPKTARIISSIEHPYGEGSYAPRRGNYQLLPNGHVFMGWSEQATHSEHDADGKLLMEATLATEWLGTYRSYKYPFVGRPVEPPKAHSAAYASKARNSTTTLVHVSQNGATEIDQWKLYKTTEKGEPKIPVFQKKRTGFETALAWDGYASYVIVEALDKDGMVIDSTEVTRTRDPPNDAISEAVSEEVYWMQEMHGENDGWKAGAYGEEPYSRAVGGSLIGFLVGAVCSAGILLLLWRLRTKGALRGIRFPRYQALADQDQEQGELGEGYPKRSQDGFRDTGE